MTSWKVLFFADKPTLQIFVLIYSWTACSGATFLIGFAYSLHTHDNNSSRINGMDTPLAWINHTFYSMAKSIRRIFYCMKVLIIVFIGKCLRIKIS